MGKESKKSSPKESWLKMGEKVEVNKFGTLSVTAPDFVFTLISQISRVAHSVRSPAFELAY